MRNKKNTNAVSVSILILLIVIIAYWCLLTLYEQFGLFNEGHDKVLEYNINFTMNYENDIDFEIGDKIYLYNSREYFCEIKEIIRDDNNLCVIGKINGFYKKGRFYLNGKTDVSNNCTVFIMNNKTEIKVISIY